MAFTKRTTCPTWTEQWWKTSFSPCIRGKATKSISEGLTVPNCVGYAWGRFAEICGYYPTGLPTGNAGTWYATDTTHEKGSTPRLGAVLVLTQPGQAGHVAIVEEIYSDGSILTSESGWSTNWNKCWWTQIRQPPNYCTGTYQFEGFIYNPEVTDTGNGTSYSGSSGAGREVNTAELDITNSQHPAQIFVTTAESHVGAGGHAWVQSQTSIGNQAWCAATMCAVAKACDYAGKIMPGAQYGAAEFGKEIVETYGGEYHAGPAMGEAFTPQPGDIIEYYAAGRSGVHQAGTRYAAYHVGVVRTVEGDTLTTIEGNTGNGEYKINTVSVSCAKIGWYARADWTKVGGTMTIADDEGFTIGNGGKLFATESTRADATLREVSYLDKEGEPSIKTTGVRLAAINYTSLLSGIVQLFGTSTSTSTSTTTTDNIDALPPKVREVVSFLVKKGLCTAAAIGVAANIRAESDFDTSAVGDNGSSFGICQWHDSRGTAMKAQVGTGWANNLTGQLNYLWYELSGAYSAVLSALKQVTNTLQGAKSAADTFVREFERPSDVDDKSLIRQGYAKEYWDKIVVVSNDASASGSSAAAQGSITTQSGKVLTEGTSTSIPSSVPQSGIVANYTSYTEFYGRWARSSTQYRLATIWGEQGKPYEHQVATISGYYLIALAPKFGTTGDIVSVVLEDNTYFNAILGDGKGADAKSEWGHYLGNQIDIVEWEAYGSNQDALRTGLREAGWLGKKVDRIINYGPWLDGGNI